MKTSTVTIKNLSNKEDANKVLEALEHVWGIGKAEIKLSHGEAIITFDERMARAEDFEQAIVENGFEISR